MANLTDVARMFAASALGSACEASLQAIDAIFPSSTEVLGAWENCRNIPLIAWGTRWETTCSCGREVEPYAQFCDACGRRLPFTGVTTRLGVPHD